MEVLDRVKRQPVVARSLVAYRRYSDDGGGRLAASVSYFAFLSFFPLVALGLSVVGLVLSGDQGARHELERTIGGYLPGLIGPGKNQISLDSIAATKAQAGILGLAGLVLSGTGWVNALRESIHVVWHEPVSDGNPIQSRLRQLSTLVVLGLAVLASVALSSGATVVTGQLLDLVGLRGSVVAAVAARVVGIAVALAVDTGVLTYLFTLVPRDPGGWRQVWRGALLGSVLLELLKLGGGLLLERTTRNPLYGPFAVVVGLLVWANLVARVLVLAAAWTVTHLDGLVVQPAVTPAVALPRTPDVTVRVAAQPAARLGHDLGLAALGGLAVAGVAVVGRGVRTLVAALAAR